MTHLPPAPEGFEYRQRRLPEGSSWATYLTTGLFPVGAPDDTEQHLAYTPVLIWDIDLPKPRPEPGPERDAALASLLTRGLAAVPHPPSAIVASGGGYHFYWHIAIEDWHRTADAREINRQLVRALAVRVVETDKGVHDTGTRIMRTPGSMNHKHAQAVPCRVIMTAPLVYPLSAFGTKAPPIEPPPPRLPTPPSTRPSLIERLDPTDALEALKADPFVAWCIAEPQAVKARSWHGLATNVAAVGGEEGRPLFHQISALDPARYDRAATDKVYSQAVDRIMSGGAPWTHTALAANGDWPGVPPARSSSPSSIAQAEAEPEDMPGDIVLGKDGRPLPAYANLRKILRGLSPRYQFNVMSQQIEFDDTPITDAHYGYVIEQLFDTYGTSFRRDDVVNAVSDTAALRQYHPVKQYLESLPAFTGVSTLPTLCRALGINPSPLHLRYLECFLIGSVLRAMCEDAEGVKMDTMLVLQGPQGCGKSTFFRLLGSPWFSDTPLVIGHKDAYSACRHHWIIEWPEMDRIRDHAVSKAFITSQRDSWRKVFGINDESHPRRCVFVGTTNEQEFLHDETGSRRYHIIRVTRAIDHALIDRDRVWSEAMAKAAAGVPHWLTMDEDADRAVSNATAQVEERWERTVERWLAKVRPDVVTIEEVLDKAVQIPVDRWDRSAFAEVGRILKRLGYEKHRIQRGGERGSEYRLPAQRLQLANNQ